MHVRRVWSDVRWLNPEKIAFALASAWLLAMGLNYVRAPRAVRWGPARTGSADAAAPLVSLGDPWPLDLSGRDDIFHDEPVNETPITEGEIPVLVDGPDDPEMEKPDVDAHEVDDEAVTVDVDEEEEQDQTPVVSEPDVAFIGSVEIERRGRWFVFEHASTGHYHSAREGEAIGEIGLRVVGVKDRVPLVEHAPPRED